MKRKLLSGILGVAVSITLLAGCGNSNTATGNTSDSGTAASTSSSSNEKQTLTVTYNDGNDKGEEGYMYQWITQAYNNWSKKDQVELDLQPVVASDSDYFTKVQTQMQDSSTSPDIFFEDTFQLNADVAAGYVADITSETDSWSDWNSAFVDSLKEGVKGSDGNTYAVPVSTDVRGLWYNKDVLEQAGLGREWQPESWQDVLDACKAIKENCADDVVPIWFACSNTDAEGTSMNTYEMLLYGTGETLFDESTGVWNVSGQGVKDSLQFIKTCKDEGYMGTPSEIFDTNSWNYGLTYMSTAKLGICLNGSWGYADYLSTGSYPMQGYTDDTLEDALGFAQMPQEKGNGYVSMSGGWSWAIAQNSDSKELAFEFLQEMMYPDNYILYLNGSGNLAVRNDMTQFEEYESKPYLEEATAMLEVTNFRPHDENYSKVSSYIYGTVDTIVRNGIEIDKAMSDLKSNVEAVAGADKVN